MLERLEDAFHRERAFVAQAGHELRAPLSTLQAELELALRRGRSSDELRDALRSAMEGTGELLRLAEGLLVIARADDGRLPLDLVEVDVDELLTSLVAGFEPQAAEMGRSFMVAAPDDVAVTVDPSWLHQALGHLVENGLAHGRGTITVGAVTRDEYVELHVTDEGSGFPEGFLPQVFEPFSRADSSGARGAAGLSLAIVDAIVRAHGGSAHAANAPTGGADVWLSLPRRGTRKLEERVVSVV